ncbi:mitochondrial Homoaconitase [Rhizoclosmatium sp. JEL0117]|nr:mitochondrial Homoaconitase [Rhizoclosmatium sp. JEL0117]
MRHFSSAPLSRAPQNLIERIVQKYAVDVSGPVKQGDFVSISPAHVMTHDNTGAVLGKFASIGASKFARASQAVFTLDHDVQNKSEKNLEKYAKIEKFAREKGVDFYPAGTGIGHQTMVEQGYAFPLSMAVASDSHSNMYGGIGCLGTPIVRTDAAAIWATGRTWWQVPPVAKVELLGKLPSGCTGKDVIVALCGLLNKDEVLNHAIEFSGPGAASLSIDERLTIANMTTEWGALAGVFPVDQTTIDFVANRINVLGPNHKRINAEALEALKKEAAEPVSKDAVYAKHITFDLASLSPHISGPNSVKVATPLSELESRNIKIHKAYLLSCVNSRQSDIKAAAEVMRGHKVAEGVEFYIAPASKEVQRDAEASGDWGVLVDAGAKVLPAGCGPCIGLGAGLLQDGEVGISATNRNFKGRMGSRSAQAYLASPAVVAASAVTGKISSPEALISSKTTAAGPKTPAFTVTIPPKPKPSASSSAKSADSTIEGFPSKHVGELIFCPQDNLDTDGIYPGAFTYQDDIPPAEMAKIAMRNYDPKFTSILKKNDVLVSGFNFGTGSSREQAATCLLHAGIPLILAGSLSETYKRNAINNGLLCLEVPDLVRDLVAEFGKPKETPTIRTGWTAEIEYGAGVLKLSKDGVVKEYSVPVVGKAAQELIVLGGLENWVKAKIAGQ